MRHGNKINHLGRKTAHRDALLMNLSNALIKHKRINTTLAKAKELRKFIEPILTKTKNDTTNSRRIIFAYLRDKESIKELFGTIADKIANRPGGYTRIIKLGFRYSDAAEMGMIELVDFNEVYNKKEASTAKTTTRRSRKKNVESNTEGVQTEAKIEETTTNEVVESTTEQTSTEETKD